MEGAFGINDCLVSLPVSSFLMNEITLQSDRWDVKREKFNYMFGVSMSN